MTPLARLLAGRIARTGPMGLAEFMAEALMHPVHGYYATRDPFGAGGDFVTAPEVSQMFGELLGLALAQAWIDQGRPAPFVLAELGPGRGTLMADAWRAAGVVPGFREAARLWLVEASPALRALQAERLPAARHAARAEDLPEGPLFLIANEFLDALPIRQFRREVDGWREVVIGLAEGALAFGLSPPVPCPDPRFAADPPGTVVELCPALPAVAAAVAERVARGGAAIFIDYGGWRSKGDTLQAVRRHVPEPPLANPGEADLTAHVDFEALARALAPLPVAGPVAQGDLLARLGIAARAERLAQGLSGAALAAHRAALVRLTDPGQMGSLFKALAAHAPGSPPPPGFA